MIKVSTGLRNKILDTSPLRAAMNLGFIKIYAGAPPATADAAIDAGNTLLCTISNAGTATGLTMAAAATAGILTKATSEVWSGINASGGVATFYRHVAVGDTAAASMTEPRIQGLIATAGSDMNLTSTVLANGATQSLDAYQLFLPTL